MERIVIHIGMPKAASTSLQYRLAQSRAELAAAGVFFPDLSRSTERPAETLAAALEAPVTGEAAAHVKAGIEALPPTASTLLLSRETLHAVPPAAFRALFAGTRAAQVPIEAGLIVRDPASWLNSHYVLKTTIFREAGPFDRYVAAALKRREACLMTQLSAWLDDAKVTLFAVPLVPREPGAPVTDRFLAAAGLPPLTAADPTRNASPDPRTVEAARRLHRYGLGKAGIRERRTARRLLLEIAEREGWTGRYNGLTPALNARILAATQESRNAFARRFWGAAWDDVYAPTEPDRLVPNDGAGTDEAAIGRVVDTVARRLSLKPRTMFGWLRPS